MMTVKKEGIPRWILIRLILHILMALLLIVSGVFVFSYNVFPRYFSHEAKPVALLIGMSSILIFAAVFASAGIGLRVIIEIARTGKPSRTSLFDLLAFTQYMTIGIILLAVYSCSL